MKFLIDFYIFDLTLYVHYLRTLHDHSLCVCSVCSVLVCKRVLETLNKPLSKHYTAFYRFFGLNKFRNVYDPRDIYVCNLKSPLSSRFLMRFLFFTPHRLIGILTVGRMVNLNAFDRFDDCFRSSCFMTLTRLSFELIYSVSRNEHQF